MKRQRRHIVNTEIIDDARGAISDFTMNSGDIRITKETLELMSYSL